MNDAAKPTPPKQCPVCHVAMQATVLRGGTHHRCEQCGLTISVAATKPKDNR
jgi:tRNA(Ile2) C34 agmatinyltransferase TiaS